MKPNIFKVLKKIWINSWLNHITHDCNKHQVKLKPNTWGYESYCNICKEPR